MGRGKDSCALLEILVDACTLEEIARALCLPEETVQGFLAGSKEPPPELWDKLRKISEIRLKDPIKKPYFLGNVEFIARLTRLIRFGLKQTKVAELLGLKPDRLAHIKAGDRRAFPWMLERIQEICLSYSIPGSLEQASLEKNRILGVLAAAKNRGASFGLKEKEEIRRSLHQGVLRYVLLQKSEPIRLPPGIPAVTLWSEDLFISGFDSSQCSDKRWKFQAHELEAIGRWFYAQARRIRNRYGKASGRLVPPRKW